MKKNILFIVSIALSHLATAQLSSTTPIKPPVQPVPNSVATEKSAVPQKTNVEVITPAIPPIYPGAETILTVTENKVIRPASPVSSTQPLQNEPQSPIEATNRLTPLRPPVEKVNRKNKIKNTPKTKS